MGRSKEKNNNTIVTNISDAVTHREVILTRSFSLIGTVAFPIFYYVHYLTSDDFQSHFAILIGMMAIFFILFVITFNKKIAYSYSNALTLILYYIATLYILYVTGIHNLSAGYLFDSLLIIFASSLLFTSHEELITYFAIIFSGIIAIIYITGVPELSYQFITATTLAGVLSATNIIIKKNTYKNLLRVRKKLHCEVAERKNAESLNQHILNSVSEGFILLNNGGSFLDVNQAYEKMVGYKREELLGKNIFSIIESSSETTKEHKENMQKKKSFQFEGKHRKKNGQHILLTNNFNYVKNQHGEFLVDVFDQTEQKKSELELRTRNQDLVRMNRIMINRELKMRELKNQILEYQKNSPEEKTNVIGDFNLIDKNTK